MELVYKKLAVLQKKEGVELEMKQILRWVDKKKPMVQASPGALMLLRLKLYL